MSHFHLSMKVQPRRSDGGKLSAKSHFDYIARQNQYAHIRGRQEDFVMSESGNLPTWARGNAGSFWEEAENHRSARGRAYREVEIGLQEELSLEDNLELLHGFMHEFHIDQYAYTFAIHSKDSTLETGHKNIHAHLMFNEKIQEKDRYLEPEKYFNAYSKTHSGEAIGGYRSSREFLSKDVLKTMRKRWAEMVNDKFKQRGIAAEITEKNNADRYDELIAQGRTEEAELVNRQAAPHLGKAYKSDKIMQHIRTLEHKEDVRDWIDLHDGKDDQSDEAEKAESDRRVKEFEQQSRQEQKLILFINDLQIRKLARQLQLERQRYRKQQEEQSRARYELVDPVTITVEDVADRMLQEETRLHYEAAEALSQYQQLQVKIYPDTVLKNDATEAVIGHDWRKEYQRHLGLKGTLKTLQKRNTGRLTMDEKIQLGKRMRKIKAAMKDSEEKLAVYDKEITRHYWKIKSVYENMQDENNKRKTAAKKCYSLYKQKEKLERKVHNQRVLLETQYQPDIILYAEKLARQVQPWCKLYGQDPIKNLPNDTFAGHRYYITGQPQWFPEKQYWVARALRLNDKMECGKAPLYKLTLTEKKSPDNPQHAVGVIIKKAEPTKESVPVYKQVEKTDFKAIQQLNWLAREAMQSDTGKLNIRWQDDERKYQKETKLERIERELYSGR